MYCFLGGTGFVESLTVSFVGERPCGGVSRGRVLAPVVDGRLRRAVVASAAQCASDPRLRYHANRGLACWVAGRAPTAKPLAMALTHRDWVKVVLVAGVGTVLEWFGESVTRPQRRFRNHVTVCQIAIQVGCPNCCCGRSS